MEYEYQYSNYPLDGIEGIFQENTPEHISDLNNSKQLIQEFVQDQLDQESVQPPVVHELFQPRVVQEFVQQVEELDGEPSNFNWDLTLCTEKFLQFWRDNKENVIFNSSELFKEFKQGIGNFTMEDLLEDFEDLTLAQI